MLLWPTVWREYVYMATEKKRCARVEGAAWRGWGAQKWENRIGTEAEAKGNFFKGREFFTGRGGTQEAMGTEDVCGWQWKRIPMDAGSPGRSVSLGYVTSKL